MPSDPQQVFDKLERRIAGKPELVDQVCGVYQFDLSGDGGGSWIVDLKNPPGSVSVGASNEADCLISVAVNDFCRIMDGDIDPMMAFMMGKVRVAGNVGMATKLSALLG
jgi:putative sterol carrier protein